MSNDPISLRRFPLFSGLPDHELQAIAPKLHFKRFETGTTILGQNEIPAFIVIVVNGQVQSTVMNEEGRVISLHFFNEDAVIGWECAMDNMPLSQTLSITKPTDLLLIPMAIAKSMLTLPWVTNEVMRILAKSIRRLTDGQRVLGLPNAYQRVYSQIVNFTNTDASQNQGTHLPRQQEIAAMVNTSRETVSRAIQSLVKQGILVKVGQQIVIQDPARLKKLAADGAEIKVSGL